MSTRSHGFSEDRTRGPEGIGREELPREGSPGGCLTVYYDGSCPLCSREIDMYRHMKGADRVRWIDIHEASPWQLGPGLTSEQALGRFHVRGADGRLVSGGAGFVTIWRSLPALRWLGWLAGRPPLSWLLEPAYRLFLRVRP